ncbi:alpha/beta hydrolase family protein [Streptomyces sp. NPDC059766]|uniref:alpha/beta hydrolase family protein n=1 Tax=Streptomyces sp. NPDC059766 TaxID=3346940 RepID=UPI00364C7BCF
MAGRTTVVAFPGAHRQRLAGRLEQPPGEVRAYALFAHCFTCSKDSVATVRIARALAKQGIATLRFDFTGLGESGGEFSETNFTSTVDDLASAADYLRSNHQAPTLLIGHSLGGAAAIAAAERIPEIQAVATIGAPADPRHVQHLIAPIRDRIASDGQAELSLGGRTFLIREQFLEDLAEQSQQRCIRELGRPLLVMHSPQDEVVGIENAGDIYQRARHPKSFVSLDGADHMLTRQDDTAYAAGILAQWASRYLDATRQPASSLTGANDHSTSDDVMQRHPTTAT